MRASTVRSIVLASSVVGLAVDAATLAVTARSWLGLSGPFVTATATTIMVATLALQAIFVTAQGFPKGRALIPLPVFGPDAWLFVISATLLPGVLWHYLAGLAAAPMQLIMPGFMTPLVTATLLLGVRVLQQRRLHTLSA